MSLSAAFGEVPSLASATPFEGGHFVRLVPFLDMGDAPNNKLIGELSDARLYTELSTLTDKDPIIPNDHFYVVRDIPDDYKDLKRPWTIRIHGLVEKPTVVAVEDLLAQRKPQGLHLLECSGNARPMGFRLLSTAAWEGVPLAEVLAPAGRKPSATQIRIAGLETDHDDHPVPLAIPGASWTFRLSDIDKAAPFLATHMNGQPLPREHGEPVRFMIPGWLGCCNIKWVNEIELVDDTAVPSRHMLSYAPLTLQQGTPKLAAEYKPALMDTAAMPIRVEQWRVGARTVYRVVGLVWGGERPVHQLVIRFNKGLNYAPVDSYQAPSDTSSWAFWYHHFEPPKAGVYRIQLRIADAGITSRRLNAGHYALDVKL